MKLGFVGALTPYHDGDADYNTNILKSLSNIKNLFIVGYVRQNNVPEIEKISYVNLPLCFEYKNVIKDGDKTPDMFHLEIGSSYPSAYVYRFFNLIKETKQPIITTLHFLPINEMRPILIRSYRTIISEPSSLYYNLNVPNLQEIITKSTKIIVLSKFARDILIERFPHCHRKVEVIPIPVDVNDIYVPESKEKIRGKLLINDDSLIIVSFGSLTPGKGFEEVIKSIKILIDDGINVKYYLLGSFNFIHYKLKIISLIKKLKLESSVQLKGYTSFENVKFYLRAADVIVQPRKGRCDESSASLVIALASGTPVIANSNLALEDYLKDGVNSLVSSYNGSDFASKIQCLYNNQELGYELGNNAIKWCYDNLSQNIINSKHIDVYKRVYNGD